MLRLRALGGLGLERDGTPLEAATGRRRALALLAQLAVASPRGVSRAKLVHRLWPDSDEEKARNVLAQTLHKLKRDVAGAEIISGSAELRLDDALISSDVAEFERHVASGHLEEAAALYDGPFLDGFYIKDTDEFERWAEEERSRLARMAGEMFEALSRKADRAGDFAMAVTWWRRVVAIDPLSTRATLGLMTALASAGDTAASLKAGSLHQALLESELGAPPDPAIDRLTKAIQSGAFVVTQAPPVFPRDREAPRVPAERPPDESIVPSVAQTGTRRSVASRRSLFIGIMVLAIATVAYALTQRVPREEVARSQPIVSPTVGSIAVLPLVNLSQAADEYLVDGVGDELTSALSRVPGLRVAAHTSALAFKGVSADAPHMASALGVQTLLEGSVRRAGRTARIAIRLVSGTDGYPLMSAEYDWNVDDPLALERAVASAIADSLRVSLPALGRIQGSHATTDALAHDLYLRGRFEWNKRTPVGLAQAVSYFRQAIARDSAYAASYAGLADALIGLSMYSTAPDLIPQAKAASDRAVAADPSLGEAHVARAMIHDIQGDGRAAEREYELAIALNPSYAPARHWHAFKLEARGQHAEAMDEIRAAYALDPLSTSIGNAYGAFLYFDRDWPHAIAVLKETLARAAEPFPVVVNLAAALSASGADTAALTAIVRLPPNDLSRPEPQAALAIANWHLGNRDSAQSIVRHLSRSGVTRANAMLMASVYAQTGEADSAFAALSRVDWRRDAVLNLRAEPTLDPLRKDPRFVRLLRTVTSR
jgi:DNA-binding SARP family transcriptional activator/TolB-like protein/Tfp pilus assembly protein PilF